MKLALPIARERMPRLRTVLLLATLLFAVACAGVLGIRPPPRKPFEHREHTLKGVACVTCHVDVAKAGETGPLHLPGTDVCVGCHTEPHDKRDCAGCHGTPYAREGAALAREHLRFQHSTHVPRLDGDCVRCHIDIANGSGILRPRMANCGRCHEHEQQLAKRTCDPCHVDLREEDTMPDDHLVHAGDWLRDHGVRAASSGELCRSCHTERFCTGCHAGTGAPVTPERLGFTDVRTPGVHRAGFVGRHADEARGDPGLCTTCHAEDACSDCHARKKIAGASGKSPHPPGWLGLPGARNDHGRAAWRDPVECASCHSGAGESLCVNCHKVGAPGGNPHAPGFSSRLRKGQDEPCRRCHEGGR